MDDAETRVTDDALPIEPSVLEPGVGHHRPDHLARMILVPLLVVFLGIVLFAYVIFEIMRVQGPSMMPNLHDGDRLLLTHGYKSPSRGDIVVIGTISQMHGREDIVKRVVAVEGDTISVQEDVAFINGVKEHDEHVVLSSSDPLSLATMTVPAGHVFVLGDNRPVSMDSRIFGPVPLAAIKSKVLWIFSLTGTGGAPRPLN